MSELIVADEHVQIYELWRQRGVRDLALCHVDFHCDMRGLLIHRGRGKAWRIDARDPRVSRPDSGNFLAHAILDGIVSSLRWVHDAFGGRRHDTGTVKYESDLTALPHRLLHRLRRGREVPLGFEELDFERFDGVRPGEHLDIDWDGIANIDYDPPRIEALMDRLLGGLEGEPPQTTYLAYSPGYSRPDRSLFDAFSEKLAHQLGARIKRLPPWQGPPCATEPTGLAASLERRLELALRRVGIF
jgi:hypothetical protein